MFYHQEVLSRRKGLGIVWLAATLGNRSSAFRKVSRKELDALDIPRACQLMYGVVRLYSRKTEQFFVDVTNVHASIRKVLSDIHAASASGSAGIDLDMPTKTRAAAEKITIAHDPVFFSGDFDAVLDWRWERHLDGLNQASQTESGIASFELDQSPDLRSSRSPSQAPHTAPRDRITLPAHRRSVLGHEASATGDEMMRGGAMSMDALGADGLDHFQDAVDLDFDVDLGLDLGDIDAEIPGIERPGARLPPRDSSIDFVGVQEDVAMPEDIEHNLELLHDPQDLQLDLGPGDQDLVRSRHSTPAERENSPPPEQSRKRRKVKCGLEDSRIELTDDEVRQQARLHIQSVVQQQADRYGKETAREIEAAIRKQLWEIPQDLAGSPLLTEFWQVTVGAHSNRIEEMYRKHIERGKPATHAAIGSPHPGATNRDDNHWEQGGQDGQDDYWPGNIAEGHEPHAMTTHDAGIAGNEAAGQQSVDSIGVGRRLQGLPDDSSTNRSALPWNAFGLSRLNEDTSFALGNQTTPIRHRSLSVDNSVERLRLAGAGPPTVISRSSLTLAKDPSQVPAPGAGDAGPMGGEEGTIAAIELERETQSFLDFAKDVAIKVQPYPLFFSDLVPVAESLPSVAASACKCHAVPLRTYPPADVGGAKSASAVYHILQLAVNRKITVKQTTPYDEITVAIVAH
ncbi:unnamed protein product [Parajaminaea phylloscopi]